MKRKSTGLITILTIITIWQSYFWFTTQFNTPSRSEFIQFGAPFASEIYIGQYWGVLTNSLIHVYIWHFSLNFVLLLLFARRVERSYGTLFFLIFGGCASIVTSCVQLAMSGDAGIGMTGVNLAFLYFMLADSDSYWKWKYFKPLALVFGSLVLVFALINFQTKWILLGFSSIITGIIFGYITGLINKNKKIQISFFSTALVICFGTLIFNPFSSEWNTIKGYESFHTGDIQTARRYYNSAIQLSDKNVVAKKNLNLILIDSLSSIAYTKHRNKKYDEARKIYNEILYLDPNYSWARENIKRLP
jgi:membrane associated rhomboid family serine protease